MCILSPLIYLVIAWIMTKAPTDWDDGLEWTNSSQSCNLDYAVMLGTITTADMFIWAIVRDLELHLASRMTDRRCRPLWPWNDDHVTGRRWLDRPRLTVARQRLSGCRAARTACYSN